MAAVAVAVGYGSAPAGAADLVAVGADGRRLAVGSVVAYGTRTGDVCAFDDDVVTVLASDTTDSTVTVAADDRCRLVLAALAPSGADSRSAGAARYTAPKAYESSGQAGTEVVTGNAAFAGDAAQAAEGLDEDPIGGAGVMGGVVAAAAASTETIDVQAVQVVWNEAHVQEYRDWTAAQYVKHHRSRTVGGLTPYDGTCEGSYVDQNVLYGPYANDILSCFYKETYNGSARVGFVTGGTYRKGVATITIDQRKLTETFEATYGGVTKRVCGTGGTLRVGWSSTCHFDVN